MGKEAFSLPGILNTVIWALPWICMTFVRTWVVLDFIFIFYFSVF